MSKTARFPILTVLFVLCNVFWSAFATAQQFPAGLGIATIPARAPEGVGQLETAPVLFPGGIDDQGREFFLNGQPAKEGKLILTASNGFFDSGTCRGFGESSLPKIGDQTLIKPNFAFLGQWKETRGTIRWHFWLPQPGAIRFNVNMRVTNQAAGSQLMVALAGKSRTVTTVDSTPDEPQPWNLVFEVADPGMHTLTLSASKIAQPGTGVGEIHTIDVYGPAITHAQLLRCRWRPAAVHGGYSCSKIHQSRMWVMTTRSMCDFSSYSPITTPFGYYGTSFEADRRSKGSFNFSMWAARSGGKVPALEEMPHLLAAGSAEAEFSGFGHEGSGVKLRGWTPMPDRPEVCVQALRVESEGNYDTYHGYFWDHPTRKWKLYAVGRKWSGGKARTHLSPGSFCEIPGPPNLQRSGDRVREVRRSGWHYGEDGAWHAMDTFECRSKGPANKLWYTTNDGKFAMRTGGMRYYEFKKPRKIEQEEQALPAFLTSQATAQLYRLPAEVDSIRPVDVGERSAKMNVIVTRAGTNARAEIYYGESDCLTFAKRELHGTERRSEVSKSTQADDRSWSHSTEISSLKDGSNLVMLDDLKRDTTYYVRVLVTNDEGKIWTFNTQTFRTQ